MHKYYTFIFIFISTILFSQDYPYPQQPLNLSTVSSDSLSFSWKGATNFTSYTLEIYDCNYYPGANFNSINLQDFVLSFDSRVSQGEEVSGFTHHEKRPGTFVGVEDSGTDLLFHTFDFNANSTYPVSNFQGSDFEGVTYLHNDYFAIMEERFGYVHFIKLIYNNNTLTNVTLENTLILSDPLISGQNDGFEGVTYNPVSGKMYASKEYNPVTLFEFDAPTAPNFSGTLTASQPFDINQVNWTPQDASGLYHFGLNKAMSATKTGEHLLILSKNSKAIYETDLNGNLISQLNFDISGILGSIVGGEFKAEGITFHDGIIWIAEDNDGLYIGFQNFNHEDPVAITNNLVHTQSGINTTGISIPACLLEAQTEYCWKITAQTSSGQSIESEYYSFTTGNLNQGAACNDNNLCTTNDVFDDNCNCAGTPVADTDNDGTCDAADQCPNLNNNLIGTACDDGDSSTINDVYTNACNCSGTLPINNICIAINNGNDDVEEYGSNGTMYFNSTDLEFVYDGNNRGNQTIGLRFNNVPVLQGVDIYDAYVQFTTDETNTASTSLTIKGEDTDHSDAFTAVDQNLSSRAKTSALANWNPPNWTQVGQSGMAQRTPDISNIIQEIVNRQGYSAGNSITLIINGNGKRTAESYNGSAAQAPQLCIEYSTIVACPAQGTACNDGKSCTTNDIMIDNNCTCEGTPVAICNTDICLGDVGIVNPINLCNCIVTQQQIMGCTNVNACNYNPQANCNDGSCQNAPSCNTNACAGNIEILDPSNPCNCIVIQTQVNGCTDANACNYNPQANCNDGSCQSAPMCNTNFCIGDVEIIDPNNPCNCMVSEAQVNGCIEVNACNYTPSANCNDNSCTYAPSFVLTHQNPTIISGGTYQAQHTILSNINFTDVATVNYFAEQRIELQNDFSVPANKMFSAVIQPVVCE